MEHERARAIRRGQRTEAGSGERGAWRRRQWWMREGFGKRVPQWQEMEMRRSDEGKILRGGRVLKLLRRHGKLGFLAGFLSGGDGFAKRAGVPAVEGFFQRLRQRRGLDIFRQHRRPGDRLQCGPMRARRGKQRYDHQDLAKTDEHAERLIYQRETASAQMIGAEVTRLVIFHLRFMGFTRCARIVPDS